METTWRACLNLECGGFVQVSSDFALGSQLSPASVYGGNQYNIIVHLFQDSNTGNWWLAFGREKKLVGYWPKSLLTHMVHGAIGAAWGGITQGPLNDSSLPMGSGHFANEGYKKAAFFTDTTIIDDKYNIAVPNTFWSKTVVNQPKLGTSKTGIGFFFGGPAGCKG
ncbi:hypothetical protein LUZ60_012669 [Juncus effusus]|nr:hypothetical protein LUZ60_012669 [Juncus effusus]